MKVWLKTLLAAFAGIILSLIIKQQEPSLPEFFLPISQTAIQLGRYAIFPLIFFGLVMGTYELRQSKITIRIYLKTLFYLITFCLIFSLVGVGSVMLFAPERIPLIIVEQQNYRIPLFWETIFSIFPTNSFQVFSGNGSLLLPVLGFAIILGSSLGFDVNITRPVIQLADSLSRIFFQINSFFVEFFWVFLVFCAASRLLSLDHNQIELYRQLIIILILDVIILLFGFLPALLFTLGERKNPFRWIYASLAPSLTGAITGDLFIGIGSLIFHGRGSFGIPRKINSAVLPIFAVFGRAGTALITSVCFILILRSYSSFEININQIIWVVFFTCLSSFILGSVPGISVLVSLSLLCSIYGRGLQEGFLLLEPISPVLISISVFLDITTAAICSKLVANNEEKVKRIDINNFV